MSWLPPDDDLDGPYAEYADHRVRSRPNPKANRPRTKRRPDHAEAVTGMVTAVDRGRYTVLLPEGTDRRDPAERLLTAARARELHRTAIVIGDRVQLVGDISGRAGSLARIVALAERRTLLRRSADDSDTVERVMVANADQMLIVAAAARPEPRVRLIDRYLVAAYDAGIAPLICITKCDLADPEPFLAHFAGLGIPTFRVQRSDWEREGASEVLHDLRSALQGRITVFVGHSGVGKSTLINALVPEADRATGRVNEVTGRGRHTSSSSVAFRVAASPETGTDTADAPGGDAASSDGWAIDTPGVRSFGLGHVTPESILAGFPELAEVIAGCPRGCTHQPDAPDCELDAAVEDGRLDTAARSRVDSLRRLLIAQR